jgi:Spy/CpxP family protein refolding chaperone
MGKKLMALAGVVALAGVAFAAPPEGGRGDGPRGWSRESFQEKLGLTDAQLAEVKKLRAEQKKKQIRTQADIRIAHMELRELLGAEKVDEKAVRAKAKEVAALREAAATDRVEGMLALRRVVTAEQAKHLMKMHHGRRGGHGRGHEGRGPDGPRGGGHRGGPRSEMAEPEGEGPEPDGEAMASNEPLD